jgi:DNA-binding XRE family transcriptional regulator
MYDVLKLRILREKNNYTVKNMADMLNISPAHYCLIENKKRNLYYDMAIKISNIFNLKPDDIFYKKD